jgi:hypothetical protein
VPYDCVYITELSFCVLYVCMFVTVFPTPVMSPSSLFRSFSFYLIEEA